MWDREKSEVENYIRESKHPWFKIVGNALGFSSSGWEKICISDFFLQSSKGYLVGSEVEHDIIVLIEGVDNMEGIIRITLKRRNMASMHAVNNIELGFEGRIMLLERLPSITRPENTDTPGREIALPMGDDHISLGQSKTVHVSWARRLDLGQDIQVGFAGGPFD